MASVNNYAIVENPFSHTPGAIGNHVSTLTYRAGCTHVPTIDLGTGNPSVNALTLTTAKSGLIPATDAKYVTCAWSLIEMRCFSNNFTALDLSTNTAMIGLYVYTNELVSLNVSGATSLTYLNCSNNSLTSLNVSTNIALTNLQLQVNNITALDVSTNTALMSLYFYENSITTLSVSTNTAMTNLRCYDNPFNDAGIAALIASMDSVAWTTTARTLNISNMPSAANINTGTTCTSLENLAAEGWVITYEQGTCTL